MRVRPLAALSLAAAAALLLAGCAGGGTPATSPSADLCAAAAGPGAASDAVTVTGDVGAAATATFSTPLAIDAVQRTVDVVGGGDAIKQGDYVQYALTAVSADDGAAVGSVGYAGASTLPVQVAPGTPAAEYFGCATAGSRIVLAVPATQSASAQVLVLDVLDIVPAAAWGASQPAQDGFPTVELAADGAPTVSVPTTAAPTTLQLETLKKGDGPVVQPGDSVLVQYTGVKWSDGSVFDSSWEKGQAASFSTTGVVPGFAQALEGQTVGSQVVAVIPPDLAYGTDTSADSSGLAGETLVFVIDILGTQSPTAP